MEVSEIFGDNFTRSSHRTLKKHWLYGALSENLPPIQLPTKLDIIRNYFLELILKK